MLRSTPWTVEDYGIRPAGPADHCFYCDQPKGKLHKPDCAIRSRTVIVRLSIDIVVDHPESYDNELIEDFYDISSWCKDGIVHVLEDAVKKANDAGKCLCGAVSATVVREATAEDEAEYGVYVDKLPT